jgi:hypothetical protein
MMYRYVVTEEITDLWKYDIYERYKLIVSGSEFFDSKFRATLAAMGHIVLLENGDKAMRVWIVTRKVELDWDEIEAVFFSPSDAKDHIKVFETDFPQDEFAIESVRVHMRGELTAVEKQEETLKFLENVSLVLGIVHGGIAEILRGADDEMRGKLTDLFNKLSRDVSSLYYPEPTQ